MWPLYLLVRRVKTQSQFLRGQVGVERWCNEAAFVCIYFKQLAHTIVRTGKPRICGVGSKLDIQARFLCCILEEECLLLQESSVFTLKAFSWLDEAHPPYGG